MIKFSLMLAISAAMLTGFVTNPAAAGCQGTIAATEKKLAAVSKSHPNYRKIQNIIGKAKTALVDGKKKRCKKLAGKAKNLVAKASPGSGKSTKKSTKGDMTKCAAGIKELESRVGALMSGPMADTEFAKLQTLRAYLADGKKKKCEKLAKARLKRLDERNK